METPETSTGSAGTPCYPSLLAKLVEELADPMKWNWTRMATHRDAADCVLETMVELGLIDGRHHPHTWSQHSTVYRVDRRLFGRTDGVDDSLFDG